MGPLANPSKLVVGNWIPDELTFIEVNAIHILGSYPSSVIALNTICNSFKSNNGKSFRLLNLVLVHSPPATI